MGSTVDSKDGKPNQMKPDIMTPGQPFWKIMTQSDKSPLHSVNQDEGGPSHGIGNNQNRGSGDDRGAPFRRNFRGAGEIPPFPLELLRGGPAPNLFLRDLPLGHLPVGGTTLNPPIPQTFDYNHGVSGGPSGQQGSIMGLGNDAPGNRREGGMPPGPRPLMEVTIPNPAALFRKLHAKLNEKEDSSRRRDPRQGDREGPSPRQTNDSETRQGGPQSRPGNQSKQKNSPQKGGNSQNEAWNRGLKRMAELKRELTHDEQTSKKRKTNTSPKDKANASKPKTPPVLEYDAESLKLMDTIAQGSQAHQLQLIKATGIKENFEPRTFVPWKCYICDTETWTWQAYIIHCKTKEHKSQAIGLGTTFMKDEKTKLLNVLRKLPYTRITFPIGKKDSQDGSTAASNPSLTTGNNPPVLTDGVSKNKGMYECKPCCRFFLQRDRLQNHIQSEGHLKREAFLKQRYGNSWLDYHWYNQSKKSERRDAEPLGIAFVLPVSGYFCKLCSRFYNSEITAKDVHCRQISHIDKVKEWDRQQLTQKEAIKLKLNAAEIETAVVKKEELARKTRWSRPKLTTNPAEVVVVDSDPEDENDKKGKGKGSENKKASESQGVEKSVVRRAVPKKRDEELEEGELSESEVLKMEKQQQEDRIKEEWMKREAKKKEKEQREREQREKELKEREAKERKEREAREAKERKEREAREAKERKEREAKEEMERQRVAREREKMKKAKEEKERRERERREREKIMRKLQEEKRQLEIQKREFQQQVAKEKKEKEERERKAKEEKEKQEKARKLQEDQEKKLRETRLREILEVETRIRQQEKRERDMLEERVRLGQMLARSAGTPDSAFIERDMRDKEIRGRVLREQLERDRKQLEELKRLQKMAPSTSAMHVEEDVRAKLEAEMKKAEEERLREERLKEVEKREKELQEIEKREQERRRIEEKERELLEIEMRDKARREQEQKELLAIRELERKARLEEEMQARQEQEMQARREQEMKVRQEQEMQARQEQEMQARQEQEMKARQEQEMQERYQQQLQARQEQEMALQEQQMQARQEQEMIRMREQELLVRREQDIQAWQMREAQMLANGVSEMEILQQRQVFQQQLEEKYRREGPLTGTDVGVTGEARNFEMERELFLNELRQKARGELMMKAMELQQQGLTDDQIQEVMVREEEIMKERIFEEMHRRGFTDVGVPSGHAGDREVNPAAESEMPYSRDTREGDGDERDREWGVSEAEIIDRERRSREREMLRRSPGRDYDEREDLRYNEEADGRPEDSRNETVSYDREYPPSPGNYSEDDDYNSDDGSYREEENFDDYDYVQGGNEDERFSGGNRDEMRGMTQDRDDTPRQGRSIRQRTWDRRRKRKKGGRGPRRRQGRGGAAQRGR